jgi:hypothetical protein
MPGVVPASDQWKSIDAAAALSKRYSGEPMPKRLVSEMGCVMVVFASWLGGQKNFGGKESWIFSNSLNIRSHHDFHKKTNRCRFWLSLAATMNRS